MKKIPIEIKKIDKYTITMNFDLNNFYTVKSFVKLKKILASRLCK